jgi:hypothetical protein
MSNYPVNATLLIAQCAANYEMPGYPQTMNKSSSIKALAAIIVRFVSAT